MEQTLTPIRKQYLKIKQNYPHEILLFRLGDFYETFDDDARITSRELDITLTSREIGKDNHIPMAGIPYHAVENYLARLINRGYKIAICEQLTRPGETKGIVERDVVRVITPGTVIEPSLLHSNDNNYLVGLAMGDDSAGMAYVDITTSDFAVTQLPLERVNAEIERLKPSEIITAEGWELPFSQHRFSISRLDNHHFETNRALDTLFRHFGVTTLDGYGCGHLPLAITAAGAILKYIQETQPAVLGHLTTLSTYSTESFMALDSQTQKNLELFQSSRLRSIEGSLLSVINLSRTPMGSRLLKRWLGQPLLDVTELVKRQDAIAWFLNNTAARNQTISSLTKLADIERLINRVRSNLSTPREMLSLKHSLKAIPTLMEILDDKNENDESINWLKRGLKPRDDVVDLITEALEDPVTSSLGEGNVVKTGFSDELDKLRMVGSNAKQYLANLERQERENTGIKSLKIGYNRVFGYYIEVSKSNLKQVPQHYIRKQTLVGGERFFTAELKEYESMILNARERITEIETNIFQRICKQVATVSDRVREVASTIAHIDVLSTLAEVAARYGYTRPVLTDDVGIAISNGRHPIVERGIPPGSFIPNDTNLSNDDNQIIILTGPNMSGKSTYLRQVALNVLLAQIGSFIPADYASIGLVDRIFTRIGAGEDIASGQSTFMVEMVETANILNNATPRSLIILDEIGRGTSTYDGLSIAQAVCEHIHNSPRLGAKTLFATHYHELVQLSDILPRVKNYNFAITEDNGKLVFLFKVIPGGVDKSYGIHVARLAGLPDSVIQKASTVLNGLETNKNSTEVAVKAKSEKKTVQQIPLFAPDPPVVDDLKNLDINSLTPLEALNRLYEFQKMARERKYKDPQDK